MNGWDSNKRRKRRLPVRPVDASATTVTRPYKILDISTSGCSVESSRPLGPVDSAVPIELPAPMRVEKPVLRAKIVWKGEDKGEEKTCYRYGLSFEQMDPESHQSLDRYVDFLRRDLHVNELDQAWRKLKTPGPK
jgi:hypothetical protein